MRTSSLKRIGVILIATPLLLGACRMDPAVLTDSERSVTKTGNPPTTPVADEPAEQDDSTDGGFAGEEVGRDPLPNAPPSKEEELIADLEENPIVSGTFAQVDECPYYTVEFDTENRTTELSRYDSSEDEEPCGSSEMVPYNVDSDGHLVAEFEDLVLEASIELDNLSVVLELMVPLDDESAGTDETEGQDLIEYGSYQITNQTVSSGRQVEPLRFFAMPDSEETNSIGAEVTAEMPVAQVVSQDSNQRGRCRGRRWWERGYR